jgi:hypothetical protein
MKSNPLNFVPEPILEKLRRLPCEAVLRRLDLYFKFDATFKPVKNPETARVFVDGPKFEGELIVTGSRFFCPVRAMGGCGAIDLVMFMEGLSFVRAVRKLRGLYGI